MKHLAVGVVLITLGLWGIFVWWESFGLVMRALIPFGLLVLGSLSVLASYNRMAVAHGNGSGEQDERAVTEES